MMPAFDPEAALTVNLTPDTQRRLAERMATRGHASLDETITSLLDETADLPAGPPWLHGPPTDEELDAALDESDRTGGTPVAEVRERLRQQFGLDRL